MSKQEVLENVLQRMAQAHNISTWSFIHREFEEKIENYFSDLQAFTFFGKQDDEKIIVKAVAKSAPKDHGLKSSGVLSTVYKNEIIFYTQLIPQYKDLNINIDGLLPKCYFTCKTIGSEFLILQDMQRYGYRRFNKSLFLDDIHIIASLKALAKFHALSMILQVKKKEVFDKITSSLYLDYHPVLKNALLQGVEYSCELFKSTKYESTILRLKLDFEGIIRDSTTKVSRLECGHGDFWKDNLLYKYSGNAITNVCIIDFQVARLLSPALDVLCFILKSTENNRRQKLPVYLKIYFQTLQNILKDNGVSPDVYPEENFKKDLRIVTPLCYMMIIMSFTLWLGIQNTTPMKSKYMCEENNISALVHRYKTIVAGVIDDVENFISFIYNHLGIVKFGQKCANNIY